MAIAPGGERFEIESPRTQPAPGQPRKSSCLWIALPVGCVVVLLVCGGGIAAIFFGAMSILKSAEPYQTALRLAQENPEVLAILGDNIEAGLAVQGSINVENNIGTVDMTIPVSGSLSSGSVRVKGQSENGQWVYEEISFSSSDGSDQVDLLPEYQSGEITDDPPIEFDLEPSES